MRTRHLLVGLALTAVGAFVFSAPSQGALLNITVTDNEYQPKNAEFEFLLFGDENVVWDWDQLNGGTANEHNVVQKKKLFRSGNPKQDGEFNLLASAGKYPYYCEVHKNDGMKGKVSIIPAASELTNESFRVNWARPGTTTGKTFDVRYKVDGGKAKYWLKNTKKKSAVFGKNDKPVAVDVSSHEYEFQVRSKKGNPKNKKWSGFSPPLLVNAI